MEIVPKLQMLWPTTLMRQGWGMTETAVAVTFTPAGSPHGASHTCGPLLPGAQAVIVDSEKLTSVAPGQGQGELWVRAPSITLGYIDNPKETKEMFDIGGWGWMRSGDEAEFEMAKIAVHGHVVETWNLCIRDRLKELIKVHPSPLLWLITGLWKSGSTRGIGECARITSLHRRSMCDRKTRRSTRRDSMGFRSQKRRGFQTGNNGLGQEQDE